MVLWRKYKYPLLVVLALIAVFYWLIEGGGISPEQPFEQIKRPNAVITDSTLNEDKDGKRVWELAVKTIEIDSETDINMLTGVKGKLYRADDSYIDIVSQGGEYDPNTGNVTLKGDVLAVYSEGWTLKCQELYWQAEQNTIIAKKDVECEKTDLFVSGDEIETDAELARIKVTGNGVVIKRS